MLSQLSTARTIVHHVTGFSVWWRRRWHENRFAKRSLAASESKLSRFLATTEASTESPRDPTRQRPFTFHLNEQLAVVQCHSFGISANATGKRFLKELDERVAFGKSSHDVPNKSDSTNWSQCSEGLFNRFLIGDEIETANEDRT